MLWAREKDQKIIQDILWKYPYTFYVFGSRAKGNPKPLSDLDLCFKDLIPSEGISKIQEEFEESDLPYTVDIVNWNRCAKAFQESIKDDLFCLSSKKIHKIARAVIIKGNHILLAFDPRPEPFHYYELGVQFYYLPGGHIEEGESPENALVRELKEELGLHGQIPGFLGTVEHIWSFKGDDVCCHTHEHNFVFTAEIQDLSPLIIPSSQEENVAFRWISLESLKEVDLRPEAIKNLILSKG